MSQELNGGGLECVLQVADLGFKICPKWSENALFGAVWVPKMSMQGSICIETNLDEQTPLITV